MQIEEARKRYVAGKVRLVDGRGGLPCLQVRTALAEADVYLYGGHVTHFQPAGQKPVLFMSQKSFFEQGKSIRGGVPVCYPWFGPKADDPAAPMHGVVRLQMWELESASELPAGEVEICLVVRASEASRRYFEGEFELRHRIRVGRELSMTLLTRNAGKKAFVVQEALHSYFAVGDVRRISISGLESAGYFDKTQAMKACPKSGAAITISGETDRTYTGTTATTSILDPVLSRRIVVGKSGSGSAVVWNPWIKKAAAMPDFGDEEWPGMVCVETANAGPDAVTVAAGAEHSMTACISAGPL